MTFWTCTMFERWNFLIRVRSFCINISIKTLLDTFLKFRKEGMITQRQSNSLWKRSVVGSGCNSCRIETSMSISALPFPQGTRVKACFQEVVDGPWLRIELDFFSPASVNLISYVSSGAPLIPWRACLVFLSSKKKTWKKLAERDHWEAKSVQRYWKGKGGNSGLEGLGRWICISKCKI